MLGEDYQGNFPLKLGPQREWAAGTAPVVGRPHCRSAAPRQGLCPELHRTEVGAANLPGGQSRATKSSLPQGSSSKKISINYVVAV